MFVIIKISSNLLQILPNNSECYVTKKWRKPSRRKIHKVMILRIDVTEKYYYIHKKEFNRKKQQQ